MSEEPLYIKPSLDGLKSDLDESGVSVYRDELDRDEGLPSARVPNLGHALLFVGFAGLLLLLSQLVALSLSRDLHNGAQLLLRPKSELASMAATYLVTLASCFLVFPLLWRLGFLAGVNWNGAAALRLSVRLVSLGISAGWCVQALSSLVPMPKTIPMDDFFKTPSDVWLVTAFGTLLAPLFEEITFRGFLLPAFSIAFDWLGPMLRYLAAFSSARFRRREPPLNLAPFREAAPAGLAPGTGNLHFRSRTAIVLASVMSSALFARLHAEQLGHALAAVGILFGVSLLLSVVRIKTRSLACSTLVHASYNLSVFLTLFIATGGYRHLDKIGR